MEERFNLKSIRKSKDLEKLKVFHARELRR